MSASPLPLNLINDALPPELLFQIFDQLSVRQQLNAMCTCVHWAQILSSNRYTTQRLLCLSPSADLVISRAEIARHRAVAISDEGELKDCFGEWFRGLVGAGEVLRGMEEIRISLGGSTLSEVFAGIEEVRFLGLRKFCLSLPERGVEEVLKCKVVAPKLKIVKVDCNEVSDGQLVQQFNEQIEELSVGFVRKEQLGDILGESLDRMTSLTMFNKGEKRDITMDDFSAAHFVMFTQLTYLNITDLKNAFYPVYEYIFREARHLETLVVHGVCMSEEAFNVISELKKLKELEIVCGIHMSSPIHRLDLPELHTLTTCQQMAPLYKVPKLRKLIVKNHPSIVRPFPFGDGGDPRGYVKVLQGLTTLRVEDSVLSKQFVYYACHLEKLVNLEMVNVEMKQLDVLKFFTYLKNLKYASFVGCTLIWEKLVKPDGASYGVQLMPNSLGVFFQMLSVQFEDIEIFNDGNRTRTIEKMSCMECCSKKKKMKKQCLAH